MGERLAEGASMLTLLLSFVVSLDAFARADTTEPARDVVRQSVHAVEGDSSTTVRARWAGRRLGRLPATPPRVRPAMNYRPPALSFSRRCRWSRSAAFPLCAIALR